MTNAVWLSFLQAMFNFQRLKKQKNKINNHFSWSLDLEWVGIGAWKFPWYELKRIRSRVKNVVRNEGLRRFPDLLQIYWKLSKAC